MKTKELEKHIYKYLHKQGTYLCFEVAIPESICNKYSCRERVDLMSYETKDNWRCYELKVSKSDFHSNAKLS